MRSLNEPIIQVTPLAAEDVVDAFDGVSLKASIYSMTAFTLWPWTRLTPKDRRGRERAELGGSGSLNLRGIERDRTRLREGECSRLSRVACRVLSGSPSIFTSKDHHHLLLLLPNTQAGSSSN